MKKGIHPQYYLAKFTDISSGKTFSIGSTKEEISVEISSASHPFFTGESKIIDTENRVDSFKKKNQAGEKLKDKVGNKKMKKEARRKSRVTKIEAKKTLTLRDMLKKAA